jgi:hypothetical protein
MPVMNAFRAANLTPESLAPGLSHQVFLIAIRDHPQAPILHRGNPLHPMHVILTGPGDMLPLAGLEAAIGPLPALPPPHRLMRNANPSAPLMPRQITGEILRDASGNLYEKVGDYVRPVNQLFTGSRGEMIDLAPIRDVTHETAVPSASSHGQWGAAGRSVASSAADPGEGYVGAEQDDAPPRPGEQRGEHSLGELVRRLTPEPGLWRLVRYADFIDVITPQLADPRRLQPRHQLACYLQMYESGTTMPISVLEDAAARELGKAGKLIPLSYDLCRKFGLSLPRPAFALASARQVYSPGIAPAGARFMTLRVALDPTAEAAAPPSTSDAPMAVTTPTLKTSIPEEFSKPWDLRLSRDEALYDMTLAASRGAWQRLLDSLLNRISGRNMKKWHALLFGKSPDQQLWDVKPPKGGLRDARIRCWVEQTLQLGGYDVARMLAEWEIHWRRRGL